MNTLPNESKIPDHLINEYPVVNNQSELAERYEATHNNIKKPKY